MGPIGAILFRSSPKNLVRCVKLTRELTHCGIIAAKKWIEHVPPFIVTWETLAMSQMATYVESKVLRDFRNVARPPLFDLSTLTSATLKELCLNLKAAGEDVELLSDEEAIVFEVQLC